MYKVNEDGFGKSFKVKLSSSTLFCVSSPPSTKEFNQSEPCSHILCWKHLEHPSSCSWALKTAARQGRKHQLIIIIIIINLIYIAQFDTNGILTALYIVITYIQMQYVHVCTYAEQSYKYTYTCLHIRTYTVTCTNIHLPTY